PPVSVTVDPSRDDEPAATTEQIERHLLASVNRDRAAAGLPALAWDDGLAAVARAHSDEMRRTHVVAHSSPTTGPAADRLRVGSVITAVADLDAVDGAGLLGGARPDEIGVGIAQGPHPQIGDNAIWIVALLADRRAL